MVEEKSLATCLACMCFSKDRPLQLEGYLDSLRKTASEAVELTVLYAASSTEFDDAYQELAGSFPEVKFLRESNFRRHVTQWSRDGAPPLVMFGCDDVVFTGDFDLTAAVEVMDDPEILGFSLRLGRNLSYAAMHRCPTRRPRFLRDDNVITWNWKDADNDWGYPFELNATVYRREFVVELVEVLNRADIVHPVLGPISERGWGHPNRFEAYGSGVAAKFAATPKMAAFPEAKAVVVTVNRVQDECPNFIYGNPGDGDPARMLQWWRDGFVLDIDAYRARQYPAIHVGELLLRHRSNPDTPPPTAPAYNFPLVALGDFRGNLERSGNAIVQHPEWERYMADGAAYFNSLDPVRPPRINFMPRLGDRTEGHRVDKCYFYQDSWVFSRVYQTMPPLIVDVGSTVLLLGIFASVAPTVSVELRAPPLKLENLTCVEGTIVELPFADGEVQFLTSAGLIQHVGLGRYGDPIDPHGCEKAFREVARVVAPGGHFVGSVPIANEQFILFNAHRVFERRQVLEFFPDFDLVDELFLYPEPGPAEAMAEFSDYQSCVWCFDLVRRTTDSLDNSNIIINGECNGL